MIVKLVVDMNLSPNWISFLESHGWSAVHWSRIGNPRASDATIVEWAVTHERVVITHDLDFGTILALTHATGPSVLQVRAADVMPDRLGDAVLAALSQHEADLSSGALVVVDESRSRVRLLPIGR
jgi:predicted nuclease of predicted toxin-antitoxin system